MKTWRLRQPEWIPPPHLGDEENLPGFAGRWTAQTVAGRLGPRFAVFPDPWGWWVEAPGERPELLLFVSHTPGSQEAVVCARQCKNPEWLERLDALFAPRPS